MACDRTGLAAGPNTNFEPLFASFLLLECLSPSATSVSIGVKLDREVLEKRFMLLRRALPPCSLLGAIARMETYAGPRLIQSHAADSSIVVKDGP